MGKTRFKLLHGERAYLVWHVYNDQRPSLETLRVMEKNLEIIADDQGLVYAFRSDHPEDMRWMVHNDGVWRYTDQAQKLSTEDRALLWAVCRDYVLN